jgi:hypothetical protein
LASAILPLDLDVLWSMNTDRFSEPLTSSDRVGRLHTA